MVLALRKISECLKTTIQCTATSDFVLSWSFMHSYMCRWNCLLYNVPLFKNCTQKPHPHNTWAKKEVYSFTCIPKILVNLQKTIQYRIDQCNVDTCL